MLGEGQIEGKREVFVYLWGKMVYIIYTINVNRQPIFYIARMALLPYPIIAYSALWAHKKYPRAKIIKCGHFLIISM